MRKNFKTLAGMAICILGALAASSCSKDEFFGLEDSEVLDYSTKTEIALSQEYADYAIAYFNMIETMKQPVDTTEMEIQGVVNGKPVYFKHGSSSVKESLELLKKAYPELEKADKIDFDEIQSIALSRNKALKDIASKMDSSTKYYYNGKYYSYGSDAWVDNISGYEDGWYFYSHNMVEGAVSDVIWYCGENGFNMNGGGLIFSDWSAVSMVGYGEWWPNIVNNAPYAEADFIVLPSTNIYGVELWNIAWNLGPAYYNSGRIHYVYNEEYDYTTFLY
ncbi:MAG: hypothetical protein J6V95_02335 [Bacteroidaceae bacterium]|nr:hypothetical protein [Bacteroidaceae bacterium]